MTHSGFARSLLLAVQREPYRPNNAELVPVIVDKAERNSDGANGGDDDDDDDYEGEEWGEVPAAGGEGAGAAGAAAAQAAHGAAARAPQLGRPMLKGSVAAA